MVRNYGYNNYNPLQNDCYRLASRLLRNPSVLDCRNTYDDLSFRRCEATRRAYMIGRFEDSEYQVNTTVIHSQPPMPPQPPIYTQPSSSTTTTTTTTNTVSSEQVGVQRSGVTCSSSGYDTAFAQWQIQRDKQVRAGKKKARIGIGLVAAGVLGNIVAREGTAINTIGDAALVGGVFVTALGLIEIADANDSVYYPHLTCTGGYLTETRRVVIDSQTCTTTRYTENYYGGSSRSYYQTTCSNKRYVTYETTTDFNRTWESGHVVTTY
jgi:hypothetical protein